ncbi:MAG TPA: DUF4157 domain-containing protein [Thermoanaerobaculia bacterium]|nr:DUF4157 domain-containing protein [Thermoanaerobaculia bacterium]
MACPAIVFPGSNVLQASFRGGLPGLLLQASRPRPGLTSATPRSTLIGRTRVIPIPATVVLARTAGRPLPAPERGQLEELFRTDLSAVRVHQDPAAQQLGALAFTVGANVHFAPGQYLPGSAHGRRLLAHELAHVLQQRSGRVRNPLGGGLAIVHDDALEAEAEAYGLRAAVALGRHSLVVPGPRVSPKANAPCGCGGSCGCGGGCGCEDGCGHGAGHPRHSHGSVQPALASKGAVQCSTLIGGRRMNPPRKGNYRAKGLTERQATKAFGLGLTKVIKKKKFVRCPPGTRPRGRNWRRTLWDGHQRPGWSPAALAILPAVCALCGAPATDRDHIVPYRRHITANANAQVFCDGTCHFWGISWADATAWSNDLANLRPLCAACNGVKAAADRLDAQNVDDPPTLMGQCNLFPLGCPLCGSTCL